MRKWRVVRSILARMCTQLLCLRCTMLAVPCQKHRFQNITELKGVAFLTYNGGLAPIPNAHLYPGISVRGLDDLVGHHL
jgi:hypothetical protein